MQLVLGKITVPDELRHITRTRLLNALDESLAHCASTIIIGRAGMGKTTLALDFAKRCERLIAWYKVNASDSDLRIFLQYLAASVSRSNGGLCCDDFDTAAAVIEAGRRIADSFVNKQLELVREPLLIVIEDLHLIYDAEWVRPFFGRLLPLLPASIHMIITGRSLPPFPLWRMRSKQTLRLIDESALAFTLHEAQQLFISYGLSGHQAFSVVQQTHGRAALLDAAASMLAARSEATQEPSGSPLKFS